MRIVFMGTPEYAKIVLESLCRSTHQIVGVVAGEDAVSKRGNKLIACPVKEFAESQNIEVITPKTLRDADVQEKIRSWAPDFICVAAYGKILPKEVLEIPTRTCLNVHASLLPRWRGAAPIERAILAGDNVQGVSIMKMEEGLDTGDYCRQQVLFGEGTTAQDLTVGLAQVGGGELVKAIYDYEILPWKKQNEEFVTYANKIEKNELNLDPIDDDVTNYRRVMASSDSHPAKCVIAGKTVRVTEASYRSDAPYFGVTWVDKKLFINSLEVIRLKPDGKNEMDAQSFVAGCKEIRDGSAIWEKC